MQQNASRDFGCFAHTEERPTEIMVGIHDRCAATAEEHGDPGNYVLGANIGLSEGFSWKPPNDWRFRADQKLFWTGWQ